VLKKPSRNSGAADAPDLRADEPERAMERFNKGLRAVISSGKLAAMKRAPRKQVKPRAHQR